MILKSTVSRPPIGWPLLPVPDAMGQLSFPTLAESVRQNLQVILSTRPGEQLMHPRYGAGLVEFIGKRDTITMRRQIQDRVASTVGRWEPRIELDRIEVEGSPEAPGRLRVQIAYRLRRTGEARNFGVNLELES